MIPGAAFTLRQPCSTLYFLTIADLRRTLRGKSTPLYRYYNPSAKDHFYTIRGGRYRGYRYEGVTARIFASRVPGSVPLYRYYQKVRRDHFYTTNSKEIGTTTRGKIGKYGYFSEGIAGYCFPKPIPLLTVPLYRYWRSAVADHFYTTNIDEIGTIKPGQVGKYEYVSEGVACYVIPA